MKAVTLWSLCGAAVVAISCAALLALPSGDAHAQSGSRLCGYIKKADDGGYTGYLYEAREAQSDYGKDCLSSANDAYIKAINYDYEGRNSLFVTDCHDLPQSKDGWHRHCGSTCEDVGVNFQSSNSPKDMCDKMEADHLYKVVFDKASKTTSYHKS